MHLFETPKVALLPPVSPVVPDGLRDYQVRAITQVRKAIADGHKRIIVCLPTGAGKTTVAAEIVRLSVARNQNCLFIAHRKELVIQCKNRLASFGLKPSVIMAEVRSRWSNVMVASVGTLVRRHFPPAKVLIVDECHHSTSTSFAKIIAHYQEQGALIVGLTATPYRMDNAPLGDLYEKIVSPIQIPELINRGFLVAPKYYGPMIDLSEIKMKGKDYDVNSLYDKYNTAKMYSNVVHHYQRFANDTRAIVFCVNVNHAQLTCQAFIEAGISARTVDGMDESSVRDRILKDHQAGVFKILCNVNICTEGYDDPSLETVILNRATKSKSLYVQMVGRCLRIAKGKTVGIVIDQGANVYEHGVVDVEEEYSLHVEKKRKKEKKAAPVKECPSCLLLNPVSVRQCKECGHLFTAAEKEEQEAEFAELDKDALVAAKAAEVPAHLRKAWHAMSIGELIELRIIKRYKPGWLLSQLYDRFLDGDRQPETWRGMIEQATALQGYSTHRWADWYTKKLGI